MSFPSPEDCLSTQKLGRTTNSLDTKEFWWFALRWVHCSEPKMMRSRLNKGRFVSFPVILVSLFVHKSHPESLPSTWKYETSEVYRPFQRASSETFPSCKDRNTAKRSAIKLHWPRTTHMIYDTWFTSLLQHTIKLRNQLLIIYKN